MLCEPSHEPQASKGKTGDRTSTWAYNIDKELHQHSISEEAPCPNTKATTPPNKHEVPRHHRPPQDTRQDICFAWSHATYKMPHLEPCDEKGGERHVEQNTFVQRLANHEPCGPHACHSLSLSWLHESSQHRRHPAFLERVASSSKRAIHPYPIKHRLLQATYRLPAGHLLTQAQRHFRLCGVVS
jgi:hypothetical protein